MRIEDLNTYQESVSGLIQEGGLIDFGLIGNIQTSLQGIEVDSYAKRLSSLADFVKMYNDQLTKLNSLPSISVSSGAVTGTGTISTTGNKGSTNSTTVIGTGASTSDLKKSTTTGTKGTVVNNNAPTYNGIKITTNNPNKIFNNFNRQTGTMEN